MSKKGRLTVGFAETAELAYGELEAEARACVDHWLELLSAWHHDSDVRLSAYRFILDGFGLIYFQRIDYDLGLVFSVTDKRLTLQAILPVGGSSH